MERKSVVVFVLLLLGMPRFAHGVPPTTQPVASDARKQEPRPYIYGCGIIWGKWLKLPDEKAKAWDRLCMDYIKKMGGTNVPANFAWHDIEPEPGRYDWDYVDHQVAEARKRGLEIFAYTGLTPDWALPPEAGGKPGIGYRFPPDEKYIPHFERFFRTLAARYRGKVKYYEFWNEPNGCGWINDGCANGHMAHTYVPWLKRWYRAMKQGDPDCVLAIGGLDYNEGVKEGYRYLEDIYAAGGGDFFDAVAIHPYGKPLHWKAIEDTYKVLLKHGHGHKKLWVNEYGWATTDEAARARDLVAVLTELKKPKYHMVFQANYLVLTDLSGGESTGKNFGLCDWDAQKLTLRPRPAWHAFRKLDKRFGPAETRPTVPASAPRADLRRGGPCACSTPVPDNSRCSDTPDHAGGDGAGCDGSGSGGRPWPFSRRSGRS